MLRKNKDMGMDGTVQNDSLIPIFETVSGSIDGFIEYSNELLIDDEMDKEDVIENLKHWTIDVGNMVNFLLLLFDKKIINDEVGLKSYQKKFLSKLDQFEKEIETEKKSVSTTHTYKGNVVSINKHKENDTEEKIFNLTNQINLYEIRIRLIENLLESIEIQSKSTLEIVN
ncbi:hypothetical protein N9315_02670 [Alphaproteobacteria bacterium]|nr:hypothetical protein [Alphaproteobacteria bacterium]